MSIPLIQNNEKDSINTSIIAIKRNIERINMLLGLVDSGSPDLSGLATKQELEDAITQVETDLAPVDEVTSGNMQSVTSNAVAEEFDNYLPSIIKSVTYAATTTPNGNFETQLNVNRPIVGCKCISTQVSTKILTPFKSAGNQVHWYVHCVNADGSIYASGSLTVEIYYLNIIM